MKLSSANIKHFRRLEDVQIDFDEQETLLVGANNSGKTSATLAFRCFLGNRSFKIHDFAVTKMAEMDEYDPELGIEIFPHISIDLWFKFDPNSIAFGRAFSLLPNISNQLDKIGMRCTYSVDDIEKLWASYIAVFPKGEDGKRKRSLSYFLGLEGILNKHFSVKYYSLEEKDNDVNPTALDVKEGKGTLSTLLKVDFVDAQRNFDDDESLNRGNKLSKAFANYYQKNLDQPEINEDAVRIIDGNNELLTDHYEANFEDLQNVIKGLGVPSVHDREIKIVSSISAETALQGNTEVMYIDGASYELPEAYNGLGFKNLIFMAVQVRHFHLQWLNIQKDRPLCHIIFIEEPEAHLHAQVQRCFISNMWKVLNKVADPNDLTPQLAITTHSSHVLDTVDFSKVRYFRRCHLKDDNPETTLVKNATEIHDLKKFQPEPLEVEGEALSETEILEFLKRYLTLTHCDLFFADGAILIEGTVERLLLPSMITKCADGLSSKYLAILEVGGAYAHRFAGLLEFLHIPYIVITDIDSVKFNNETKRYNACSASEPESVTSNASLKYFFPEAHAIEKLSVFDVAEHIQSENMRHVTFQKPLDIQRDADSLKLHGRTFEETFVYENLELIENGELDLSITVPTVSADIGEQIFKHINLGSLKKTDFALKVLSSDNWNVPSYISSGLQWFEERLDAQIDDVEENIE